MNKYINRITIVFIVFCTIQSIVLSQQETTLAETIRANSNLPELIAILQKDNLDQQFEQAIFSNDERYIAVTKTDATSAIIIDNNDGLIVQVQHQSDIVDILFSSDNKLLLTVGADMSIKSWNLEDFQLQAQLISEADSIFTVAWQETLFFIAETDKITLWDAFLGENITTIEPDIEPTYMFMSYRNSYLSILDETQNINIFDANNLENMPINVIETECQDSIIAFSFSNDDTYIYEGCSNGDMVVKSLISEEFIVLSNLNYIPFVLGEYANTILPIVNGDVISFANIVMIDEIEELSLLVDEDLTHNTYQAVTLDGSIIFLGIEPLDDWENTGVGAPAFNVIDTDTGEIIYFFGQTQHVQLSTNNSYILTVSLEGEVLIFRVKS